MKMRPVFEFDKHCVGFKQLSCYRNLGELWEVGLKTSNWSQCLVLAADESISKIEKCAKTPLLKKGPYLNNFEYFGKRPDFAKFYWPHLLVHKVIKGRQ